MEINARFSGLFAQYPRGGWGMSYFVNRFRSATSEMPSSFASCLMGFSQTF